MPQKLACVFLTVVTFAGALSGAELKRPSLRVAPSESRLPTWQPALGEGLAQMMITELARLTNLQILESVALDDLREERTLGESGEIDRSERIKRGHWKSAEYTFKTTITRFGVEHSSSGGSSPIQIRLPFGGGGGVQVHNHKCEVQIDWRIVDNTTGTIVKSGRGSGTESGKAVSIAGFGGGGWSSSREFADSGLGKATMKAVASIVFELEEWTPPLHSGRDELDVKKHAGELSAVQTKRDMERKIKAEVILVDGSNVWVAVGSAQSFAVGDRLTVYRKTEKKNKTGKVVVVDFEAVGSLELVKVQPEKSCGRLVQAAQVEEGWIATLDGIDPSTLP